jgi:RsmE family RNA methyltransferase
MNLILLFESDFNETDPGRVRLSGRRREHAVSVCKACAGSVLRVGKINGKIGKAEVLGDMREFMDLRVKFDEEPPKPLPLTLIVAMPRPKSFLKCVEAATVLGVKKMIFMNSFRVEKNYWGSRRISEEIIREHVVIGLEQARDTVEPAIEFRRRFKPFVEDELPQIVNGTRALAAHPYAASACPYGVDCPVTLAIGPEGGFIPYEIDMLKRVGFEDVSFGERILRVEHAIAALIGRVM